MALDLAYRLRALTTENLNLKLLSLAFALVLYGWVHGSQEAQRSLLLGVIALTPPESSTRELVTPIPAQIRVTLRGARSTLDELHADDIGSVQIDLRSGSVTRLTFEPSMIPVPPGLDSGADRSPRGRSRLGRPHPRDVPVEVGIVGHAGVGLRRQRHAHVRSRDGAREGTQERGDGRAARPRRRVRRHGPHRRQVHAPARRSNARRGASHSMCPVSRPPSRSRAKCRSAHSSGCPSR